MTYKAIGYSKIWWAAGVGQILFLKSSNVFDQKKAWMQLSAAETKHKKPTNINPLWPLTK
jgi:hypothetical protein